VQLLERLGHQVVFPPRQTCCGQMHINTGYLAEAAALVRHHVEVFEDADCEAAVAPSGSCVGSVRHQHAMVARRAGDEALASVPRPSRRAPTSCPNCLSTCSTCATSGLLPAPGDLPPHLPLTADAAGRR
jgi:hypothetical protein